MTVAHVVLAGLLGVEVVRALHQSWVREALPDEGTLFAFAVIFPLASAVASFGALSLGVRWRMAERAAVTDLGTLAGTLGAPLLLSLPDLPARAVPALFVALLALRAAPLGILLARRRPRLTGALTRALVPDGYRRLAPKRALAVFIAANALLVIALALGPLPEGCGGAAATPRCSALAKWLPWGLALATLLTAALAWRMPSRRLFARHLLFWGAIPLALAVAPAESSEPALYGLPIVLLTVGIALHGTLALHETRALRSDRAIGRLIALTMLASSLALLPYVRTAQPTTADEPHYLIAMQSLAGDHDLDLRDEYDRQDYFDFYPVPLPDRHTIRFGEREYPIHDVGLPLLGALPFAIARRTGVLVLVCLVGAAFAWRGYLFLRRVAFGRDVALLATAAVVLGHPVFTYTTQIYPDLFGALVVLLVAEPLDRPASVARLASASALLGTLPWLSVRLWFVVVGLGLVLGYRALRPLIDGRWRAAARLVAAGALPFAVLIGAYGALDFALYAVPLPNFGYFAIRDQQVVLAYTPQLGLTGLLLDRTFGLLSYTPLYALAFFGAVPLWRRGRALGSAGLSALVLASATYLVYVGDVQYWWADDAPPSRYLLATTPLLLCALAAGLERARETVARALVLTAAAWSVATVSLFALLPNLRHDLAVDVRPLGGPGQLWVVSTHALRADPALLFPSLVRAAPSDVFVAAAWAATLAAIIYLGARRPHTQA